MSVRDYARNYLPDGSRRPAAATGRGAVGSDASSGSTPGLGTHALDGPEHTDATGTDRLLATIDHVGLVPPLSGNPADALRGDLSWGATSGSAGDEEFVEHEELGSAEDFDPADGDAHTGILDDDCTATILAPAGDGPIQMEWWITADGDGHELTIEAAGGGTVLGDTPPPSVDGETYRLVIDRIPGTTNDWIVNLVGGTTGVVGELDDLTDVTITTAAEGDMLRFNGSIWVNSPLKWEAVTDGEDVFVWEGDSLVHEWSAP